jgi:HEPN domain-containing protein
MDGGLHARACFAAQQCAEKALKGVWHARGEEPWGHSVQKLVMGCRGLDGAPDLERWRRTASALDRFYISTRYPNGLPDLTPEQSYFREDAEAAIRQAEWLLTECRRIYDVLASAGEGLAAR